MHIVLLSYMCVYGGSCSRFESFCACLDMLRSTQHSSYISNLSLLLRCLDDMDIGAQVTRDKVAMGKAAQVRRSFNPKKLPEVTLPQPASPESPLSFVTRLSTNISVLVMKSVSDGSRDTYSTAWRAWESFCSIAHADPTLAVPCPVWSSVISLLSYPVQMIAWFISHLQSRIPVLAAITIDNYVSGLRYCLMQLDFDAALFKDKVIVQLRAALNIRHRIDNPECDAKTLPFLCEWFPMLRRLKSLNKPEEFMIVVALELAFVCLLRASEVVVTAENHFLRAVDVSFIVLVDGVEVWIPPHEACLYSLDSLVAISIKIRSAKNDQGGRGYKYYFTRDAELSALSSFDLIEDMFLLAKMTKPVGEAAFFSMGTYVLPYRTFNTTVKLVATSHDADEDRFSCHSMRIGGATVLAASNFPDYVIQNMGRWKSLEFLHYLHWNPSTMALAMSSLMNPSVFTFADLTKMNSGASRGVQKKNLVKKKK